ncbi:diguanylate cyclase [Clostridium gasigenes]|uniref:diguanylate cyclase domain-containing protein n=1 Tax=Clostridium gasigenes TaxID=94869 RepID=UPI001C0C8FFB|nr:diguanylate cyclase [Clostridium gasigenes]MBU3136127.1 diguanylate cyclase [Clostridium gasigenes]
MGSNEKISMKIDLYATLMVGYFFVACIAFVYLELSKSLEGYIMLMILMIVAQISYYLEKTGALIVGMIVDFVYCTYKVYLSFTKGVVLDNKIFYWIIIVPLTALLISTIAELILEMQVKISELEEKNKKFIMMDESTGIKNGSAFINEMPIYMNLHKRYKMPITLVMVRLKYSDKLASIVGEDLFKEVIRKCSEVLGETLRYEDGKYLIDKKTFAYILICDEDGALVVKNRMKEAVREIKIGKEKLYKNLNVEVQIGGFTQNEQVIDPMNFINLAEKELEYDV